MKTPLLLMLFSLVANQPHQHTYEDLLQFKCGKGNQEACEKLQVLQIEKQQAERIEQRVTAYAKELEAKNLMLDHRRPDLKSAYPLVMGDYFTSLNESGSEEVMVSQVKLQQCATHYHEYWLNKKLWWPNEDGKPDWADIYVFIIDHYYGFCVKQI